MTTIANFRQVSGNLPEALKRVAQEPQVKRDTAYYAATIGSIKSIDAFMGNDRVYAYVMKAFGLEDMTYAKAFIRRVLKEGIDAKDSFANRLADPRYRELAETFNFARYGTATTSFTRTQQGTVDRYVRQTLELEAGSQNEGVRLALYFQRKAPAITSAYGLLADRALLKVTQVALGLSESTSAIDVDRQAELIAKKLDIADFKKPEKLDKLLTRFAALWDIDTPSSNSSPIVDLVSGGNGSGIGMDILGRLQNLDKRR